MSDFCLLWNTVLSRTLIFIRVLVMFVNDGGRNNQQQRVDPQQNPSL